MERPAPVEQGWRRILTIPKLALGHALVEMRSEDGDASSPPGTPRTPFRDELSVDKTGTDSWPMRSLHLDVLSEDGDASVLSEDARSENVNASVPFNGLFLDKHRSGGDASRPRVSFHLDSPLNEGGDASAPVKSFHLDAMELGDATVCKKSSLRSDSVDTRTHRLRVSFCSHSPDACSTTREFCEGFHLDSLDVDSEEDRDASWGLTSLHLDVRSEDGDASRLSRCSSRKAFSEDGEASCTPKSLHLDVLSEEDDASWRLRSLHLDVCSEDEIDSQSLKVQEFKIQGVAGALSQLMMPVFWRRRSV